MRVEGLANLISHLPKILGLFKLFDLRKSDARPLVLKKWGNLGTPLNLDKARSQRISGRIVRKFP